MTQLELLSTEESLITIDASVAASDAALIQDQIALIKTLGGGPVLMAGSWIALCSSLILRLAKSRPSAFA